MKNDKYEAICEIASKVVENVSPDEKLFLVPSLERMLSEGQNFLENKHAKSQILGIGITGFEPVLVPILLPLLNELFSAITKDLVKDWLKDSIRQLILCKNEKKQNSSKLEVESMKKMKNCLKDISQEFKNRMITNGYKHNEAEKASQCLLSTLIENNNVLFNLLTE